MDPVTHALLGAATARVALAGRLGRSAWLPGVAGGLLPDADALIRSVEDPLLYAEFHRHFTHSLAFIPVGGFAAALPWLLRPRTRSQWGWYLIAATSGYATHGLLDAGTTYGTRLLWPFADDRVAWNVISIIDPLFTLILLAGLLVSARNGSARPAALALLLCLAYLTTGAMQRERALEAQRQLALARGHDLGRGAVFPSFANNVIWRSLYRADVTLHMDRLRVPWFGAPTWRAGPAVRTLEIRDLPADVTADARLLHDFRRFQWFTGGWVAGAQDGSGVIGDARYSLATERFEPVWGIRLIPAAPAPVEWVNRTRQRRLDLRELWIELRGRDLRYRRFDR